MSIHQIPWRIEVAAWVSFCALRDCATLWRLQAIYPIEVQPDISSLVMLGIGLVFSPSPRICRPLNGLSLSIFKCLNAMLIMALRMLLCFRTLLG